MKKTAILYGIQAIVLLAFALFITRDIEFDLNAGDFYLVIPCHQVLMVLSILSLLNGGISLLIRSPRRVVSILLTVLALGYTCFSALAFRFTIHSMALSGVSQRYSANSELPIYGESIGMYPLVFILLQLLIMSLSLSQLMKKKH